MFLLVLAQVILDVVGVASILPFMQVLSDRNAVWNNEFLRLIYNGFGFSTQKGFLIGLGLVVLTIIIITNTIGLISTWLKLNFSWKMAHKFAMRLLRIKMEKPYEYFLQTNSSEIKTYIISETNNIASGIIMSLIDFISKSMVTLILLVLLVVVNWQVSLIMFGTLGGAYMLIYFFKHKYLSEIGEQRLTSNTMRYWSLNEMLNGIKTIMVHNTQPLFYDKFGKANNEFCDLQPKYQFLIVAPNYLLQIMAFGTIISLTIYFYLVTNNVNDYIPTLTLYALAGYRLLPSLQGAFASLAKLKQNQIVLEKLHPELKEGKSFDYQDYKQPKERLAFSDSIELKDAVFKYEQAEENVLNGMNLNIKKGQRVAFVGSTGSGKTSAIDVLVGLHKLKSGDLNIDGVKVTAENVKQWQNNIAYVPQDVFLFDDTVLSNITMGASSTELDMERLIAATKIADIHNFIEENMPQGYDTMIGERGVRLSGGQRQRLGLARAIYMQPELLVLDEATSSVDMVTEQNIIKALNNLPKDMTLIVIAHRLATVKDVDVIYFLQDGNIVNQGDFESLQKENIAFKDLVDLS